MSSFLYNILLLHHGKVTINSYSKTARTFFVRAVSVSIINQFKLYNRFCLCLASVHLPYPFHLVFGFQLFGHAVSLRQLRHDQLHAVSCRFVNLSAILSYVHPAIARAAFEYAKNNGKTRGSIVTKANIMKKTDGKFTAVAHEIARDYPGITVDDWYIDIMTANLLNEAIRDQFQVVLLPNLYGDIITDEAAQIQGGVETAGSANIGDQFALFEAVHGSAPRLIEQGLSAYANPSSILRATAMLLRHICRTGAARRLEQALNSCALTVAPGASTGAEFANAVLCAL